MSSLIKVWQKQLFAESLSRAHTTLKLEHTTLKLDNFQKTNQMGSFQKIYLIMIRMRGI